MEKPHGVFISKTLLIVTLILLQSPASAEAKWFTDYEKAMKEAKLLGRYILADFTGSDWCIWCKRLKREVFNTREFRRWSDANVVLLELDYPRSKHQSSRIKSQNAKLKQKYNIRGYPTILFLNPYGNSVGKMGYQKGGPVGWISRAEGILKTQPKIKGGIAPAKDIDFTRSRVQNFMDKAKSMIQPLLTKEEPPKPPKRNVLPEDSMHIRLKSGVSLIGAIKEKEDGIIEVDSGNIKVSIHKDQIEYIGNVSENSSQIEQDT